MFVCIYIYVYITDHRITMINYHRSQNYKPVCICSFPDPPLVGASVRLLLLTEYSLSRGQCRAVTVCVCVCFRSAADVDSLTCSSDTPGGLPELHLPPCRLPRCTRCWLPPSTSSLWVQHVKAPQCLCYPLQPFSLTRTLSPPFNPH